MGLSGCQRPTSSLPGVRSKGRGSFQKHGLRSHAASLPGAFGSLLQRGSYVLVRALSSLRRVPGPPVRLQYWVRGVGQRTVHLTALSGASPAVHSRACERVAKSHRLAELDEPGCLGWCGIGCDAEQLGCAEKQPSIANRLGCCDEQERSRRLGQRAHPAGVVLLDPV